MLHRYFVGPIGGNAQLVSQPAVLFDDEDNASYVSSHWSGWDSVDALPVNSVFGGVFADDMDVFVIPATFASSNNQTSFLADGVTRFAYNQGQWQTDSDEYANADGDDDDSYISRGARDITQCDLGVPHWVLSGVTRSSNNAALGSSAVSVFDTASNTLVAQTTSSALGEFAAPLYSTGPFYMVAYKSGSPDVAGTTVNTLTPTPQ